MFCSDGFVDLDDIEFHLVQDIEHIVLKIGIGLIDLIDQQDHPFIGDKGLPDFSHPNILFNIADIPFGVTEPTIIQTSECVVLVKGIDRASYSI